MRFGCTARGLLLKEESFQLLGRTGEQIVPGRISTLSRVLGSGAAFQTNLLWQKSNRLALELIFVFESSILH